MRTMIDAPGVQRVVLEDLEHGEDHLRVVAQYAQGFLCTTLANPLRTRSAHSINNVGRHAERDTLWDWE
jgi:hypothetical protein